MPVSNRRSSRNSELGTRFRVTIRQGQTRPPLVDEVDTAILDQLSEVGTGPNIPRSRAVVYARWAQGAVSAPSHESMVVEAFAPTWSMTSA